jgi:maltooligosyltrehalose trehalohydrolase
MGEEWAASTRWPFFTSHPEPELATVTGEGRVAEFVGHGWDVAQMIDPQDPAAYRGAILDWAEIVEPAHASVLELYRSLIALRAAQPELRDGDLSRVEVDFDEAARWLVVRRGSFHVVANLSGASRTVPVTAQRVVLATGDAELGDGRVSIAPESAAVLR